MRFKDKPFPHKQVDSRIIRRFLFIPLKLGEETRWLEYANIEQVVALESGGDYEFYLRWFDNRFVDL